MKKVLFQGSEYSVPDEYKFIAKDANGYVYAYTVKPYWNDTEWYVPRDSGLYLGNYNCLEIE